ncbi:MAG: Rab family GTPase [Candidatus Hodarchaeota archaeon]
MCLVKLIPPDSQKPLKIVILGEGGVGKTTLSKTFTNKSFFTQAKQTIAVEFHSKVLYDYSSSQNRLQIWDLGGQEQFKNMGVFKEFCRGSDAALLCFDLTDLSSLFSIPEWIDFIEPGVPRFLVGTKSDIASAEERAFDLMPFQEKFQCIASFKCSSKDVQSVLGIFDSIVDFIHRIKNDKMKSCSKTALDIPKHLIIS